MLSFAQKVAQIQKNGLPVVEGFAVEVTTAAPEQLATFLGAKLGGSWQATRRGNWVALLVPSGARQPSLAEAWEIVRQLRGLSGVIAAEPSLFVQNAEPNGATAQRAFGLWGRVSDERERQINEQSKVLHWSPNVLKLPQAWAHWRLEHPGAAEPGDGILIAQLDTGYSPNPRFTDKLVADGPGKFGRDFADRSKADALDPIADFSGHGTRIGSVIVASQENGKPWGVAPGARIVPLRVSNTVIHLSFQNVSDAFGEAIDRKAHVITMSLGGPVASKQLFTRVREALDAGIIVVSAAGNMIPGVVFPARLPGVIACAASNVLGRPWRWSGLGDEVTITAPGEQVWHEEAFKGGQIKDPDKGDGTSYATAHMAGLAALWLSYHGRDKLIAGPCGGDPRLLPFFFRHCLQTSAELTDFIGFGFGAGLANAERLLKQPLPSKGDVAELREDILSVMPDHVFNLQRLRKILTLPTLTADMPEGPRTKKALADGQEQLKAFLAEVGIGKRSPGLADDEARQELEADLAELAILAAADLELGAVLARFAGATRPTVTAVALRRHLLSRRALSPSLTRKLLLAQEGDALAWQANRPEAGSLNGETSDPDPLQGRGATPPLFRRLKAYAFDPSLQTSSDARINQITIPVVFERQLKPGPVGDYLEVVDVDPASGCAYAPVDLNHPWLLAQDGVDRSEGNPQFHQQMVYAVAMKTIGHFEDALGRPIFWAPLRPWDEASGDDRRATLKFDKKTGRQIKSDQFVQHLRLFPHALRSQNAYYSPVKRAILFGYFPAGDSDPGAEYPGGLVFTCLAHDIIAHEMTHAILDGMHYRFTEPTNPDVFAFHEAFADIVALFQRFTYRELVEDQIAKARGRLDTGTLITQLALQFGQATGRHHALRDALGYVVEQSREKGPGEFRDLAAPAGADGAARKTIVDAARNFDQETRLQWKRFKADPALLAQVEEPHDRGSFLVAAVFDAYLTIYEARIADLRRIATGGTGILPDGDLHPDLVKRMAHEATLAAGQVLRICIRAMDYVPPTDLTFGDFLRALITADSDLVPDDDRHYRLAFIEAFRKWGIYPRDVRTLSEESLRWSSPANAVFKITPELEKLRGSLMKWQPGESRFAIFWAIQKAQAKLHEIVKEMPDGSRKQDLLGGIDTTRTFQVCNLRPARRIGPRGEFLTEMVVEILQDKEDSPADDGAVPFTGGATLVISFEKENFRIRYAIHKRLDSPARETRQREFLRASGEGSAAAEYSTQGLADGWFSDPAVSSQWKAGRNTGSEHMRASSCSCRRIRMTAKTAKRETFALLHRR